ncbi:MAG: type II secretion system F family protein [Sphingobium sp.]|jgi:tight adherence protein B|uniref:Tight adherence protein B n=1 Tax=Sphingobium xenophagum TaxID=121428 RepID=A0A401IZU6_SPHXE|nr:MULTISPECIES: type II secretion system F family protein [Sphingobium]MBU0658875.1 type II secretion system F family protein [Alphaproteobacteria bacterium]MBA4753686.1 type II secretion system F family protein [Sphingobium sp.]MBS86873.1 pilus assembly protein TadB [Sphingobium sp.]MBU0775395.1 type II secretion system F family protein [Alphaproteobacteria bacterium]MBU0868094.1 type II secretion system F family protein [Alphaproteobacteria bacterium]|tara:strand:- start:4483 stop:5481 length:999 start_codon:yes stop_codon:yes gene_type:complete
MDGNFILITVLVATMLGMAIIAFAGPSPEKARKRRVAMIRGRHSDSAEALLEARMRKAISNRSTGAEAKMLVSLIPNPENLTKRIRMTGKKWTLSQYMTASAGIFLVLSAFLMVRGFPFLMAVMVGMAAALFLPHWWVSRLIKQRINRFNAKFPDALELLTRGLRSGLPIAETLGIVSSEIPGPVGEEFKLITERIKIGKTMEQALQETADRLGTPEFQFFVITLAIQRETGGNLAETLSNLATVLRQRAQMKLKIRAMSSESKASAYIIGCLPFLVFFMICYINFNYMSPFFTPDPAGIFGLSLMQVIGIGGMCWMAIGAFIMAQMVNFEI